MVRLAGLLLLALLVMAAPSPGGSPKDAKIRAEQAGDVEMLAEAYQLAETAEKLKLPELYVAAGHLLLRVEKRTGGKFGKFEETPKVFDENDNEIKVEVKTGETDNLPALAKSYFAKAEDMGLQQNLLKPLKILIDAVKENPSTDLERAAIGGPKLIARVLGAKQSHTWAIAFDTLTPGAIGFQATAPCHCKMVNQDGRVHFNQTVQVGRYVWQPKGQNLHRSFMITIRNPHAVPVTYKLFTN